MGDNTDDDFGTAAAPQVTLLSLAYLARISSYGVLE
jgi:hypothetical protein